MHYLPLSTPFRLFYRLPSLKQGQTQIWNLILICGVLSLSELMFLSTSSSKASTSDSFVSHTGEFLSGCDSLAWVTGLRQYKSPSISSGSICGTTIRRTRETEPGNSKLRTLVLFHLQRSVTAFIPSLIHFYSTWLILPEELLWVFKSKWSFKPTCWEKFSTVPSSIQRVWKDIFWKIHFFLPFHQNFLLVKFLSYKYGSYCWVKSYNIPLFLR